MGGWGGGGGESYRLKDVKENVKLNWFPKG